MSYTERYIFQSSLLIMTPHSFRLNAEGTGGIPVTFPPPRPSLIKQSEKKIDRGTFILTDDRRRMSQIGTDTSTCPKARWFDSFRGVRRAPGGTCFGASFFIFFSTRSSARLEQWRSKPAPLKYVTLDHQLVGTPLFKGGVKNEDTCCRHHAIKKKWLLERAISFYNCQPAKGLFEGALNCVRPATYPDGQIIK